MALFDDIVANLTQEFLGESSDRLSRMQVSLTNLASSGGADREAILGLSREIQSVKGAAANFHFRTVATVAHRFEDYMSATLDQTPLPIEDYQRFVDVLSDLIELGREPDPKHAAQVQSKLPILAAFDPTSVSAKPGRALVVIRARTMGHMLSRELANCGFMAQTALDAFDAIRLAVTERPDVVLTSAVMDENLGRRPDRRDPVDEADRRPALRGRDILRPQPSGTRRPAEGCRCGASRQNPVGRSRSRPDRRGAALREPPDRAFPLCRARQSCSNPPP
ncbi:MAG: Hpt domain-containing protein [Thalassobaculum sp.]